MSWAALLVLAAGSYALKAVGPLLVGGRPLPARLAAVTALLPPALLTALVVVQTVGDQRALVWDARMAGVAVAGVAAALRAPFVAVIVVGMVTTAVLRALGLG